jgi:biotin carboxyl carrier protein
MSKELHLTCSSRAHDGLIDIISPCIGRAKLLIGEGQILSNRQAIAQLWVLNHYFWLHGPDGIEGSVVKIKNHDRLINLAYGEPLLVLDPRGLKETAKVVTSTKSETVAPAKCSIDAPMDGMFYLSPSPKDPPFVHVGDEISPGQTLGLIEVMKCFYPITYTGSSKAKVLSINVKDATAVNSGTKLYLLSTDA